MTIPSQDNYILTFTGRQFWPLDPRAEDLCIEDIAHALSHICRFNGHVRQFYSVAQHCVLASIFVPVKHALGALLHDAAEAYLCDISRPVKQHADMQHYRDAEACLDALINDVFHVNIHAPEIKAIDNKLLLTERRDLMPPEHWLIDAQKCYPQRIQPWNSIARTEHLFLARYRELNHTHINMILKA